jgi:hypothetical protein
MKLRLVHDDEGRIVSFVPPGAELPGPQPAEQRIAEVDAPDIDPEELSLSHLEREYRLDLESDPPRLVPQHMEGVPRSGAGRPLERSSTFPPSSEGAG